MRRIGSELRRVKRAGFRLIASRPLTKLPRMVRMGGIAPHLSFVGPLTIGYQDTATVADTKIRCVAPRGGGCRKMLRGQLNISEAHR